jgi:uracil-DNA glycosylase family 4
MDSQDTYWQDRAALEWQVESGVTDAILDAPVDRYALDPVPAKKPVADTAPPTPAAPLPEVDPIAVARAAAAAAADLPSLAAAIAAYPHCEIKQGARNAVFADGHADARVMIVGEAPGREEDRAGKPFVGQAGQLLDRMLAAIDLGRAHVNRTRGVYITNVMPWRPPSNRTPDAAEIAMMLPFLERHIALVDPEVIVLMGNTPCQALLGRKGITALRGTWTEVLGKPCLPMFHPAYLLRNTAAKREAWSDLLALNARLKT